MPAIDPDLCAVIRCAYCGRFALDPPEAPPATDREAWEFLTEQHWPECPWVQTRAWSLSLRPGVPRYPRGVLNMDGPTLRAAGWQLTTEHSASSYGLAVLVAPDGEALGDGEMVSVQPDGTLSQDLSGLLYTGAQLRELLEPAGCPSAEALRRTRE
jgi:hypothetical protein